MLEIRNFRCEQIPDAPPKGFKGSYNEFYKNKNKRTVASIWEKGDPFPAVDQAMGEYLQSLGYVYSLEYKDQTDKALTSAARHCRKHQILPLITPMVEEAVGMKVKLEWDSKAGCPCGCSPGYFVKTEKGYLRGWNIWADICTTDYVEPPPPPETEKQKAMRVQREMNDEYAALFGLK